MRVFLTGATGFVGREILKALLRDGHQVVCLVQEKSLPKLQLDEGEVNLCISDVFNLAILEEGMADCDVVIHLIGIIREFHWKRETFQRFHVEATKNIITAARKSHIKRFILMSGLGVEKEIDTRYMNSKRIMETLVREGGFDYTVFRPSIIFGERDRFLNLFLGMIKNPILPFVPVVGDGNYLLQPISNKNVAHAFSRALLSASAVNQIYDLAGPKTYSMNQLLDMLGKTAGRQKTPKIHLPVWLIKIFARLFNQLPLFPITPDQVKMLGVSNVSSNWQKAFDEFDMDPIRLEQYLVELR